MCRFIQASIVGEYAAELTFFLFKVAESMMEPAVRLFIYDSVCLNEYPDDNTCVHIHHHPQREVYVQHAAAQYMMYYKLLLNFPAMILVLLCGAWSDRTGRKFPILITCFGSTLAVILYMLSNYVNGRVPFIPLILVGAAVRGAFGRSAVMTMAVHSYVSDYSTRERRTRKLSNLVAMSHFGYLVGSLSVGTLLDNYGFSAVFLVVIAIQTFCVVSAFICLRDGDELKEQKEGAGKYGSCKVLVPKVSEEEEEEDQEQTCDAKTPLLARVRLLSTAHADTLIDYASVARGDNCVAPSQPTKGPAIDGLEKSAEEKLKGGHVEMVPHSDDSAADETTVLIATRPDSGRPLGLCANILESFSVLTKWRPGRGRCNILLLFIIINLQQTCKSGETDVVLLYVERTPLNMSKTMYGYLLATSYACLGVGAFVGPALLQRLLGLGDGALTLIGTACKIASLAVISVSGTTWMLFVAIAVAGPHSMTISSVKSMISKTVSEGEMGKAFSLMSSGETFSNLMGTVIFTNLYSVTLTVYPGLIFIIEAGIYVVMFIVLLEMTCSVSCSSWCGGATVSNTATAGQSTSTDSTTRTVYCSP